MKKEMILVLILSVALSCDDVVALEIHFDPTGNVELQRKTQLEADALTDVQRLAATFPLSDREKDILRKMTVSKTLSRYRSFGGYSFTNEDIRILERLVGTEARSKNSDLKVGLFKEAGMEPFVVAHMNSLLVKMYQARSRTLFGSEDVQYWKPAKNVLDAREKDVFRLK